MKKCSECKENKQLSDFSKNRSSKDGLQFACKECRSRRGKSLRGRIQNKKDKAKKLYGLDLETAEMLRSLPCDICGDMSSPSVIDHNHKTGEVRGSLCSSCNKGIGHLQDSPIIMKKALEYLEERGYYGT